MMNQSGMDAVDAKSQTGMEGSMWPANKKMENMKKESSLYRKSSSSPEASVSPSCSSAWADQFLCR